MATRPIRRSVVAFFVILLASWVAPSGAQEPAKRAAPQAPPTSNNDPITASRNHVEGVIRERKVIAGRAYATISIGSNDAVAKNMQFKVLSQDGQWLGYVTVTQVDQEEAIGVLSGPRINQIKATDRVTNQTDPAEEMKSLKQLLKDYQEENASLRERVWKLEAEVAKLKENRTVTIVPPPGATPPVPKDWKPFQFNGMTYYLVPLAGDRPGAGAVHTTVPQRVIVERQSDRPAQP